MIKFLTGDILKNEAEVLVNTVNCVGVMGRGIALQFKEAFPENFNAYADACKRNEVTPGKLFVFETGQLTPPRYIVNFPTKRHWRGKSRIEDIEAGLKSLVTFIQTKAIRTIALPPLGSGLGGLDWKVVRPLIEDALRPYEDVQVFVYEPIEKLASEIQSDQREVPNMTAGRAALVELMHRYLGGLLDPFVTLLEVHKLMYFLQEAGEPLRLRYRAAPYGPYAENLRHVLHQIEGYMISGYAQGGDQPHKPLTIVPGAVEDASAFLNDHPETLKRFDRVSTLVEGFESPFGLELLSTVHWVIHNERVCTLQEIIKKTYAWNDRKKQFTERQIGIAVDVLTKHGWTKAKIEREMA